MRDKPRLFYNCDSLDHISVHCPMPRDRKRCNDKRTADMAQYGQVKQVMHGPVVDVVEEEEEVTDSRVNTIRKCIQTYAVVNTVLNSNPLSHTTNENLVACYVGDKQLAALLDTGRDINLMSQKIALQLGLKLGKSNKKFKAANKTAMKPQSLVKLLLRLTPTGTPLPFRFYVFDDDSVEKNTMILGTPFMRQCDSLELVKKRMVYCGKQYLFVMMPQATNSDQVRSVREMPESKLF